MKKQGRKRKKRGRKRKRRGKVGGDTWRLNKT